ncbi:hypothetical protein [Citrobacter portucalensis]
MPLHASGAGKALLYPLMEEELMDIAIMNIRGAYVEYA